MLLYSGALQIADKTKRHLEANIFENWGGGGGGGAIGVSSKPKPEGAGKEGHLDADDGHEKSKDEKRKSVPQNEIKKAGETN